MTAPSSDAPVRKPRSMPQITLIAVLLLVGVTVVIALFRGGTSASNVDSNLVAIVPFRVAGADSGVAYLGEGMMDLLAERMTGATRAVDPQTVISAWRGGDSLELAARLDAGAVLMGDVAGSAQQLTLTATLVAASDGAVLATATVAGSGDSVPALVDRLADQLSLGSAPLDSPRATGSAAALRAYLGGRAAYRRGEYAAAIKQLERALVHDSTLTPAALFLLSAHSWGAPPPTIARVQRLAWDGRDRLRPRERALLESFVGPRFPAPPHQAEILTAAEQAVSLARDNPDAWYWFGDQVYRHGAYLGYADHLERARTAFERAWKLDAAFAAPLGRLIELAVQRGDTAEVRRLAPLYLDTSGVRRGSVSAAVRWQIAHALGDSALHHEVMQMLDTAVTLRAQIAWLALSYGAHEDVERTLRGDRLTVMRQRVVVRLNQGRVREALASAESAAIDHHALRVHAAIYLGVNDSARTAASVRQLARVAADRPPRNHAERVAQYGAITLLGEWAITNGDAVGASRAAARLRAEPGDPAIVAHYGAVWAELLDGHAAALRGLPAAAAHADRADSLLRLGAELWAPGIENLVLAALYDALGEETQALAAVRRGSAEGMGFLQVLFYREEARLAAKAGDLEDARLAYQRYLRLLSNPDPEFAALAPSP